MKERTISLIVGATTVAGIVGLVVLLSAVGGLNRAWETGYRLTIELPTAGGLHADSRVEYNGIDIGRIDSIRFQDAPKSGVLVAATITETGIELPDDVAARVVSPMLGGSASAHLIRDPGPVAGYLPTDGSAVVTGKPAVDFSEVAQQMARLTDQFQGLSREWTRVGENINLLVEQRTTDEVDDGEAMGNLATVLDRADKRLAELRSAIEGVNSYVNDQELREDVRTTAANARELSQRFNDSLDTLRARYVAVADDLSATVQSMQKLADNALESDGTFGKMMNDPELYENLNDASQRLKAAIDDVRLLVEKWKAEGLPVQF
jgi:phospholipid/cholesterol/gamma-HCH transport system substrate-binding protein